MFDLAESRRQRKLPKIEAAIKELRSEVKHANEQMANDQREIERLRAQTRALLAKLKAA